MDSRLRRKGEKIIWKVMTSAITFEGSREDKKRFDAMLMVWPISQ